MASVAIWLTEKNVFFPEKETRTLNSIQKCHTLLLRKQPVKQSFEALCDQMRQIYDLLNTYREQSKENNPFLVSWTLKST